LAASCWLTWACTVIALGRQVQPRVHVRYTKLDHISQKTAKQLSVPNLKRKARQDIRFIR
jgi:hypothetical protein